jgi:glycosyltransferase involved in cell wall biosynthesis
MDKTVLFVHDGPMYKNPSGDYFGISLDDKVVNRYSFFGKNVVFLMRGKTINKSEENRFSKITYPFFNLIEIPNFKSITKYLIKKKEAKKIIANAVSKSDVVIVRLPSTAGVIAFKYAQELKKPLLVEFVACPFDALWNYDWRGKLLAFFKLYQYKRLMKRATHSIYVTNRFLQDRYPTTGKQIGCSDVEIKNIDRIHLEKRKNKIFNQKGALILGTIAALDVPYKGQADVIKAIGLLQKKGISFKYRIVGRGNPSGLKKVIIKSKAENLVDIIGPLQHEKIFRFVEEIDVYVQPSKVEGLPRSLVEAMSVACPSIGSEVGGIPELISKESVFKVGNINKLMEKLQSINKVWLEKQANLNFITAKNYQKHLLEERRKMFYSEFKKDCQL